MQVQDIDVDIYNYKPLGHGEKTDLIVRHRYIDTKHFQILLGVMFEESSLPILEILIYYRKYQKKQIVTIDVSSKKSGTFLHEVTVLDGIQIQASQKLVIVYPHYSLAAAPDDIRKSSLAEFNTRFFEITEIYHPLPTNIYAVGIQDGVIYIYNEAFSSYFEVIEVIRFQIQILLTFFSKGKRKTFAFLICADDGYMEGFPANLGTIRNREKIADFFSEERSRRIPSEKLQDNEYAVLHRAKWVLAMSNKIGFPYTIDIVDRHYFYCSLYHEFRSFHRGIPFSQKIPKIVYAGRLHNSSRFNFLQKREKTHDETQREYFYSDAVSKENVVAEKGKWIESREMVEYKYILDMDGNACTWDATAWKLNSGSVLFKVESGWRQWFYDEFHPWTHYVPIADDFSNLQEKYHWCETHPAECEQMISNAKDLFQEIYRFSNVVEYTRNVLSRLMSSS